MTKEELELKLISLGCPKIVYTNGFGIFNFNGTFLKIHQNSKSEFKLSFKMKTVGSDLVVIINEAKGLVPYYGLEGISILKKLKPLLNPIFDDILKNSFLENINTNCSFELDYTDYIFTDTFSMVAIASQREDKNYPEKFSIVSSGQTQNLKNSLTFLTVDDDNKMFQSLNGSFYETFFNEKFSNLGIGNLDFSSCKNIYDVFDEVNRLKLLQHMVEI